MFTEIIGNHFVSAHLFGISEKKIVPLDFVSPKMGGSDFHIARLHYERAQYLLIENLESGLFRFLKYVRTKKSALILEAIVQTSVHL